MAMIDDQGHLLQPPPFLQYPPSTVETDNLVALQWFTLG